MSYWHDDRLERNYGTARGGRSDRYSYDAYQRCLPPTPALLRQFHRAKPAVASELAAAVVGRLAELGDAEGRVVAFGLAGSAGGAPHGGERFAIRGMASSIAVCMCTTFPTGPLGRFVWLDESGLETTIVGQLDNLTWLGSVGSREPRGTAQSN